MLPLKSLKNGIKFFGIILVLLLARFCSIFTAHAHWRLSCKRLFRFCKTHVFEVLNVTVASFVGKPDGGMRDGGSPVVEDLVMKLLVGGAPILGSLACQFCDASAHFGHVLGDFLGGAPTHLRQGSG